MTRFFARTVLGTLVLVVAGASVPGRAGDVQSFIIAPRDGYGISECLEKTADCGPVIADAWCEAHGLSKALSYGHVEDVTAAIPSMASAQTSREPRKTTAASLRAPNERIEPGSYVINCQQ